MTSGIKYERGVGVAASSPANAAPPHSGARHTTHPFAPLPTAVELLPSRCTRYLPSPSSASLVTSIMSGAVATTSGPALLPSVCWQWHPSWHATVRSGAFIASGPSLLLGVACWKNACTPVLFPWALHLFVLMLFAARQRRRMVHRVASLGAE